MTHKISKMLKRFFVFCLIMVIPIFSIACSFSSSPESNCIVSIEKTRTEGTLDYYTITYLDGTTSELTIKNGTNGTNGTNGKDITIDEIYEKYIEEYGDISYKDFCEKYLVLSANDNSKVINDCLQSSLKLYTEFKVTTSQPIYLDTIMGPMIVGYNEIKTKSVMCGSGIIYKIENDYTYVLTNYHVVYSSSANSDNGTKIASKIVGYLYGSGDKYLPVDTETTGTDGYMVYNYGNYAIDFEYVGGSIDYDIALLKVPTTQIKAINENIQAVEFADEYYVGETAIAIGNPENEGISATQGIVSVDNENIYLAIDSTTRSYRSIRIDTAIYGGSSGGGLFNTYGKLIGITNAGDTDDQNINYAIPIEIVKSVTDNIMAYYTGTAVSNVKKVTIGVTVISENSKYVYDKNKGYGKICEDIVINSITANSIAQTLELESGDKITALVINGVEYNIFRNFNLGDLLLTIRENDVISIKYVRNSQELQTINYTILATDII